MRRGKQVSCLLTDLGSQHGTWHNGSRLKPFDDVRLRANDTVELGTAPRSRQGSRTAGGSGGASGQAAASGQRRQRPAVIAVAGADTQPPLRATAAALRQLPRVEVSDTRPRTAPSAPVPLLTAPCSAEMSFACRSSVLDDLQLHHPNRLTFTWLMSLPQLQGGRLSGVVMDSGRVVYLDVAARAAQLSRDHEFAAARTLLQRHLASSPRNGALWSQVPRK